MVNSLFSGPIKYIVQQYGTSKLPVACYVNRLMLSISVGGGDGIVYS